mmetsp:Transcript_6716/g.11955  ORF Transcript_6716/g.11955 Transcript_6716/m.11955 type:complete len:1093 (+) Transcript_6716:3955-7233(+)
MASGTLLDKKHKLECKMHPDAEEESIIEYAECLRKPLWKSVIFCFCVLATGGLLFLLAWWFTRVKVRLLFSECLPSEASHLLVKTKHAEDLVPTETKFSSSLGEIITFEHRCMPFYLSRDKFEPLFFEVRHPYQTLLENYSAGTTLEQVEDRRLLLGKSEIEVPVKNIPTLMVEEILHPFFVFQVFSCILWFWDTYYYYASAIVVISSVSLASNLITTRNNLLSIKALATTNRPDTTRILREGKIEEKYSWQIVPGDLIEIQSNWIMPCDAVIFQGNCIVEEGMLTGESTPVLKDPLPSLSSVVYNVEQDKRHSLYEGTRIIQSRAVNGSTIALVTRTGFQTFKGKLVRSILFPKPNRFKFYEDSLKFIAVLAFIALVGFFVTLPRQLSKGVGSAILVDRSLDLITVTVPPALPAAMAVGTAFAISRLKKQRIICTSPPRVNVSGRIDTVVFDKTGTLTEDGMDLLGLRPVHAAKFTKQTLSIIEHQLLQENLATCHSLAYCNHELIGDPQELRIFRGSGWTYREAKDDEVILASVRSGLGKEGKTQQDLTNKVGILHIFHFSSKLKRMGVITKSLTEEHFRLHVKGAPEVVLEFCNASTIPEDFKKVLRVYTQAGYRVLACATKLLPGVKFTDIKSLELQAIEDNLNLLGLIILENKLKSETIPSLEKLKDADIKVVMATGDNILTAVSVAKGCNMLTQSSNIYICDLEDSNPSWHIYDATTDELSEKLDDEVPWLQSVHSDQLALALTGDSFAHISKQAQSSSTASKVMDGILDKGVVFARMSPDHKTLLVELLQSKAKLVGMCGDGANDCGALKRADIGISLSTAEASIAAPFTSAIPDISCVLVTLREGRCALATSLQEFKYMALYSMIQFVTVVTLYWFAVNLTDSQFLIIDLFTILPLAMFMSYTGPHTVLAKRKPIGELISPTVLSSVIGQTGLVMIFQIVGLLVLTDQSFYSPVHVSDANDQEESQRKSNCYENTTLFLISMAQYVIICLVFSIGKPFKQPAYKNLWLTANLVILSFLVLYIVIDPAGFMRSLFDLKYLSLGFRFELLGISIIYGVCAILYEHLIVTAVDIRAQRRELLQKLKA